MSIHRMESDPNTWLASAALALHSQGMSASAGTNRSWPILSLVSLAVLCAINIYLSLFSVPKLEQIFQDALPGMTLPAITLFVIAARFPLAFIALAWPLVGIIAVWQRHRAALWIVRLGLLFFFALIPFTIIALFLPMSGNLIATSDTPLPNAASSH